MSNTAVLCFIPSVQMYCCSSAILIYRRTREVFVKISWIPLGTLNVQENTAKLTLNPVTQYSELHNDSSREVTKVKQS